MVKFSDHYTIDGRDETAIADPMPLIPHMATTLEDNTTATGAGSPRGVGHGRLRYKRAFIAVNNPDSNDELRMMTFHSGDRVSHLTISHDGGLTTATNVDIGIYLSNGTAHDGALVDVDLFDSAADMSTAALDRDEAYTAGALTGLDRGRPLWEAMQTGDGTDTVDPNVEYDICVTFTTNPTGTLNLVMEAYYHSGD